MRHIIDTLAKHGIGQMATEEIVSYIYLFLDDEDMYVQERAIQLLGQHRHAPARDRLVALVKTAMPNGQEAAKAALKAMRRK